MGRYSARNPVHFGIDLIKAYVAPEPEGCRLYGLSENSEAIYYDKNTVCRFVPHLAGAKYSKYIEIVDRETNARLAFVLVANREAQGSVERKDVFEVTGTGCTVRSTRYWVAFLFALRLRITGFKRVDICLDLGLPTDYLCRRVFFPILESRKKQTWKPYYKNGLATGAEVGEKNPAKNTWKYIRIYDKILDTSEKGKDWIYGFSERGIKDLTRIELELRRDKCKHFHEEYLTDPEALYGIFKNEVFFLNWQFLKFIHGEDARACFESHVLEPFGTFEKLSLTAGEAKRKAVERLDRLINNGKAFDDVERAKAIFTAYARGLAVSGFDYGGLCDLVRLALERNTHENAIFDAKKAVLEALEGVGTA